jgi:hypothetical protein
MFTSEITVEFTPLPKEMEEAYWTTLNYFAEVILNEMKKESEPLVSVDEAHKFLKI